MILTKEVKIKYRYNDRDYYSNLGYDVSNREIIIKVEDLKTGSTVRINVICHNCKTEKNIEYRKYLINIKNRNFYTCTKCSYIKGKKTTLEKHDNENYRNIEKMKKTFLKKYGKEHIFHVKKVKEKTKKTLIKKYNNINYNNPEKIKLTKFEKHGDEKYNNFEKYKQTCLKKYKCDNYFSTDKFKKSQGILIDKEIKDKWILYKRKSKRIIKKIKGKIFEKWNGYDYYDKEYIKNNSNLHFSHGDYPTIDHKISVFYGFKNNISVEDINNLDNLVITKRRINSSKGYKI